MLNETNHSPHQEMQEVIDSLKQDIGSVETALRNFNLVNSDCWSFVQRYGLHTKTEFVQRILENIKAQFFPEKERDATEALKEEETVKVFVRLAQLGSCSSETCATEDEAAKLLANTCMHYKSELTEQLISMNASRLIAAKLAALPVDSGSVFPLLRISFYLSNDDKAKSELSKLNFLATLAKLLERSLTTQWPAFENVAHECLKVMFPMTLHLGPLSGSQTPPTVEEMAIFRALVPLLTRILAMKPEDAFVPMKSTAVNNMINTPLVSLLEQQLKTDDESAAETLTPTLLVLTSIARDMILARQILRKYLFPIEPSTTPEPEKVPIHASPQIEHHTIGGKLFKHMTAVNPGLSYYANEFLFQLCGEDADEFVALTGFGNAAGLLQMRGLFGFGKNVTKAIPSNAPNPQALAEEFVIEAKKQEKAMAELIASMDASSLKGPPRDAK